MITLRLGNVEMFAIKGPEKDRKEYSELLAFMT